MDSILPTAFLAMRSLIPLIIQDGHLFFSVMLTWSVGSLQAEATATVRKLAGFQLAEFHFFAAPGTTDSTLPLLAETTQFKIAS